MTALPQRPSRIDREKPHRVFISYSWDSADHKALVKRLADMLNDESDIACIIDQYEPDPGHLPNWMAEQIEWANKLLLVFSPSYHARFTGRTPTGQGQGSKWEGAIIQQRLYEANFLHQRECRALLPPGASRTEHVPQLLRAFVCYTLPTERNSDYRRLVDDFIRQGSDLSASPADHETSLPRPIEAYLDTAKELSDAGNHAKAIPVLEEALAESDSSDGHLAKVKVRCHLAHALYEAREDFAAAEELFREALALAPIGNLELRHDVLHGLGDMLLFSGRLDEAQATIHAALEAARLTGRQSDLAASLISQSLLKRTLGLHDQAVSSLEEAVQLLLQRDLRLTDEKKKRDNAHLLAVSYINRALLCRDAGDLEEALAFYGRADDKYQISGDKLNAGKAFLFCGEVHCANADWEQGFSCFRRALEAFKEADSPLWGARSLEHLSRLYATHERWEEALQAILAAVAGAEESGQPSEQVRFLLLARGLLRQWKKNTARENLARGVRSLVGQLPDHERDEAMAGITSGAADMADAIDDAVRDDEQARTLLEQAKDIAEKGELDELLAGCLLDEARALRKPEDADPQRALLLQASELLKRELRRAQAPKRRGHLMGRISGIHRQLGDPTQALSWLKRTGRVFERAGDAFGLANYYGSLAEVHHSAGQLEDEIGAYRKVLELIEGRSFPELAAGSRINLAAALRSRRSFDEVLRLLEEAEVICERHHLNHLISAIARNRSKTQAELQVARAPAHTLAQVLASLGDLLAYRSDLTVAYLAFWYFAWRNELLAIARSGPHLSLMVVTEDAERFLGLAAALRHLADHFLMTTPGDVPLVEVEPRILPIPPDWRFPSDFPFLVRRRTPGKDATRGFHEDDPLPSIHLEGPATMLPMYMMVEVDSHVEGEGHVMASSAPKIPKAAIDLMVHHPIKTLIRRNAVWFPTIRSFSSDPFLTDLRLGHERGVIPVYFDRFPISDRVVAGDSLRLRVPSAPSGSPAPSWAEHWTRALLRLMKLARDQAQAALLEMSELTGTAGATTETTDIEIRLFEFDHIEERLCHPALLARGEAAATINDASINRT